MKKNNKYKTKRFLFPILSLVLISIILIASINTYLTISMFKNHMQNHINHTKKEYVNKYKSIIYKDVYFVNDSINFQITKIENKLKSSLKEKVKIALDITNILYKEYKNKLSKEEIKEKISSALSTIRFNENRGYYFMYDNKTKIIFGHPLKKFVGKDMSNFKDAKGQSLMQLDKNVLEKQKIGFSKIYFVKPDNQNKQFPKITCVTKFEPLDIVIGTGEYLDVIENQIKKYVLDRFSKIKYKEENKYLFILDLHNINGGDEFATVLLNSNRTDLVGTKVSDSKKDIKGKIYRKEFLKILKEKGGGYSQYWFQKPSTNLPEEKISYIFLQKDWNWIIGSGFYFGDLEKQISLMQESIKIHTNETINKTLMWVLFLSLIAILVAIYVSFKIDKTIKDYTNKIIKYEDAKRKQDNLLIQQSKMASMGEMMESIAHQWRQPLSVISSSSSGIKLQKELGVLSDEQLLDLCENITRSTSHMSDTINDFRNFFKKDKIKKDFKLRDSFDKTKTLLISILDSENIKLVENIEDITIYGFENELVQVFMNILSNAKEQLEINDSEKIIFIDIKKINNKIVISIKDNAQGISSDILPQIFDSHFTTKEKRNGTGIGLYMCKKIVEESFGGTLKAYNVSFTYNNINYKGAEFKIVLFVK